MRRRSITGPLLLLLVGGLFLWRNLHPEAPVFDLIAQYWPFLLIAWGLLRIVEIVIRREEGWRYSFSGGEVVLVVLICIAGSGLSAAHEHGFRINTGGIDWWGQQYDYSVSAHASATGMTRIVFENPRGNLRVTGADTQEVTVSGHKLVRAYAQHDADRTNETTPVEIVPQGDRLVIRTNQERTPDNQRISDDLEVTVPRGVAVEARSRTGDYDISDVAGPLELGPEHGDVRLARVGGNVRMDLGRSDLVHAVDVKGTVDIQGRGSDIDLENIDGQVTIAGSFGGALEFKKLAKPLQFEGRNTELRAMAVPGTISMTLSECTAKDVVGPLRLVTRSRDVTLEQFTQSLDLDAQLGSVTLRPGRTPLPNIDARYSGGESIELVLPDRASFDLQATAERGEAENDYGPSIEKVTVGHTSTLRGKVGQGATIRLTADRGSVSVRKEGSEPSGAVPPAPPKSPKEPQTPQGTEL